MSFNEIFTKSKQLSGAAELYWMQDYLPIPVWGDHRPGAEKVACILWGRYQHIRPSLETVQSWFGQSTVGGIALITGRITNLAILDFDDPALFARFQSKYPHLTKTKTVQTRRGFHLYFHVPAHLPLQTTKTAGVDLLWNGCYVIAPPTRFTDHTYSMQKGGQPQSLTQHDIRHIYAFLSSQKSMPTGEAPEKIEATGLHEEDLLNLYRHHAEMGNRNNALFQVALHARDHRWSRAQTLKVLVQEHAHNQLASESKNSRLREAIATIKSAYSRPPRPIKQKSSRAIPALIAEQLMQQGLTCAYRVIQALRNQGFEDGTYLCRQQIIDALAGLVGRHSVLAAMKAVLSDGEPLFERLCSHNQPPSPPNTSIAKSATADTIKKCFLNSVTKSNFSPEGRKKHWYKLPSDEELARKFSVKLIRIKDDLPAQALRSAKETRMAAYKAYIERKPGQYARKWLANRVGIHAVTKSRYDREIDDLQVEPRYLETPLHWHNLGEIPDFEQGGYFLMDENRKRYPARQGIAAKLLKQGKSVSLMRQWFNYYYVGASKPPVFINEQPVPMPAQPAPIARMAQNGGKFAIVASKGVDVAKAPEMMQKSLLQKAEPTRHYAVKVSHRKLRDQELEEKANRLKRRINRLSDNPAHQLSIVSARRLVTQYDFRHIEKVIWRIEWRDQVENPAGLLTTILRSENKLYQEERKI